MMHTYKNISDKVEPSIVEAISRIDQTSKRLAIPFILVGAPARDVIFSAIFGIPTMRATLDIDLAVRVRSWAEYRSFSDALLQGEAFFAEKEKMAHRLRHVNGTFVDLIPFGELEDPAGYISWPPHQNVVMPTIGLTDVFDAGIMIRFRNDPVLDVSVATLAGLAISKLIAWNDRSTATPKDASDLYCIMTKYVDAGNDDRAHTSDSDISKELDFDYSMVSPRLLGRDMASIAKAGTREAIGQILNQETRSGSDFRLCRQMSPGSLIEDETELVLKLLRQLQLGFTEKR